MMINSARDLAAAVRGRRTDLHMSQADLASQVGVSRAWINQVEAGKASIDFGKVLRLLDTLGLHFELVNLGDVDKLDKHRSVDLDSILDRYRGE
jgi:y4mF family transcriptional regulator